MSILERRRLRMPWENWGARWSMGEFWSMPCAVPDITPINYIWTSTGGMEIRLVLIETHGYDTWEEKETWLSDAPWGTEHWERDPGGRRQV